MNTNTTTTAGTPQNPYSTSETETYSSPGSLSGVGIAIIIVVIIIAIAKIALIVYCCMRCHRRRERKRAMKMSNLQADTSYTNGSHGIAAAHGRPTYYGEVPVYRPQDTRGPYKPVGAVNEPMPVHNKDRPVEAAPGYGNGR